MRLALTVAALIAAASVTPGWASMPTLTKMPKPATQQSCMSWASKQDEDATYMWGMQEDGESSDPVARSRLTSVCLGGKRPEIVGFGSSAGFDEAFCQKHPGTQICIKAGR